jgi:hypothetical protein
MTKTYYSAHAAHARSFDVRLAYGFADEMGNNCARNVQGDILHVYQSLGLGLGNAPLGDRELGC